MTAKKRIGRPPLPSGKAQSRQIGVRFRPDEYNWVREEAEREGMTVSEFVRHRTVGLGAAFAPD